jgi:glycosyltransferase involved in cell wall biosynthesis
VKTLDIILPLRNPPAAFEKTVESLLAQTDRRFTVLLSDNHSTSGAEIIPAVAKKLASAGIFARCVRPPIELGRVEHWNWAMTESSAEWLKPVFAGDWLEPDYVSIIREAAEENPACRYIFCSYVLHPGSNPPVTVTSPWAGRFRPPSEMQQRVLSHGMQFGPPSAAAYERGAFIAIGGYATTLPICADGLTFCTMASRFGVLGIAEPLCHFNIHDARFSTKLPGRRRDSLRELLTFYGMLGYRAWAGFMPLPAISFARLLWRQGREYGWGGPE